MGKLKQRFTGTTEKAMLQLEPVIDMTTHTIQFGVNYHVQYNPSSIQISTSAGSFKQTSFGGEGVGKFSQYNVPPQTQLSALLIFDDMVPDDAFMYSKFTNAAPTKLVQDLANQTAVMKAGYGHTVQPYVEGLLSLISSAQKRIVRFCWAEMAFFGELTSVDAKYTMFNPNGNPVRAEVQIEIQQYGMYTKESQSYYEEAFDAIFGSEEVKSQVQFDAGSNMEFIQNILNI